MSHHVPPRLYPLFSWITCMTHFILASLWVNNGYVWPESMWLITVSVLALGLLSSLLHYLTHGYARIRVRSGCKRHLEEVMADSGFRNMGAFLEEMAALWELCSAERKAGRFLATTKADKTETRIVPVHALDRMIAGRTSSQTKKSS